jgi:hypothetical protein
MDQVHGNKECLYTICIMDWKLYLADFF